MQLGIFPGNAKTCYAPEIFASKDLSRLHLHKEPLVHVSAPIFSYSRGKEMRLRDQLVALEVAEALSIWIVATNSPDGDVVHRLCRTLAKELLAWKIHLVICEACGSGELGRTKGAREGCAVAWEAWWGPGRAKGAGCMGGAPVMAGTRHGLVCKRDMGGAWGMSVRGVTHRRGL